ncbi:acylphosphatase [Methylobacterium nodulans]|uniref:acylphosphatase n=1 Tax=Methylobacterium nodulans (strain LMG 21967 / CNCM I-2342 / ORS 2060) TaxID=460265 RepID=B8IS68_METNO|nr:acylphosphatase [Methylobacterium nodulans]ACL56880.1 acylphosphatase [Methylobacterium nodulans ORS 2060]
MGNRTVKVVISGRVQGVGFRAWTRGEAARRGLSGHVRNRPDGTVEALLAGPSDAVEQMIAALRGGPVGARVTAVAVEAASEAPPAGFIILRG